MIDSFGAYLYRQVLPRPGRILATTHPYVAVAGAGLLVYWPKPLGIPPFTLDALSAIVFVYNPVVFGFTVAAIALVIAIPSEAFLAFVVDQPNEPYRDLLFIFSWTGVIHWIGFVTLIMALLLFGKDAEITHLVDMTPRSLYFFLLIAIEFYCADSTPKCITGKRPRPSLGGEEDLVG